MNHFERKHISPFLQGLSLISLRFIDIFFIWTGSKGDFTLGGVSALRWTISKRHRSDLAYQL